ncbi:hypothetical protein D9M71_825310 [compost metagenome]
MSPALRITPPVALAFGLMASTSRLPNWKSKVCSRRDKPRAFGRSDSVSEGRHCRSSISTSSIRTCQSEGVASASRSYSTMAIKPAR